MDLIISPTAEEDLDNIEDPEELERVSKKLDDILSKLKRAFDPEKVIEKRLSGNWSPIMQHRAGNYRIWFVRGKDSKKQIMENYIL